MNAGIFAAMVLCAKQESLAHHVIHENIGISRIKALPIEARKIGFYLVPVNRSFSETTFDAEVMRFQWSA